MSTANVQSMREAFDAFARGDKGAWGNLVALSVEVVPIGDWPEDKIRGRDAAWDFLREVDEPWEPGRYDLTEVIEGGDHVLARMQRDLRGKASGVQVKYDYWVGFTFAEGRATRIEWFATRAEALEAAGISGSWRTRD